MANDLLPDPNTPFGERVRRRLAEETVIWLTTVGRDGTPQPNPVWFLWEGTDSVLIYNTPVANRLTHVKQRPQVALHFDGDGSGSDIVVLTGTAEQLDGHPLAHENPEYTAKYAERAARISGDVASFAKAYPVALRIKVTRIRGF
ncbi:MAG TPA: TIGR03667 family PPOX class F420-dependent oxidoreductase [Pseudonocardiaceae bacterium]|jgi:PPOX class probable F420-dependent enzyme|nr:TIGR03667 family PPOX class F420-dependent oxidoreductase [Pseudonocardiaceae bacterium]